jgi:peptidoglycan/xylan/chitin deacetylase (PgdA/CDA1 family)
LRPSSITAALTAPLVTRRLPAGPRPAVLLTFDDGPVPGVTEGVLERLAAHGARAVFFVLGPRAAAAPGLIRAVAEAGHAVGNHSFDHDMAALPRPDRYLADMAACSRAVAEAAGAPPRFFRAPGGRLHPASLVGPPRHGMRHVLWSLDSDDWRCTEPEAARAAAARVLASVQDRDIILLHDYDTVVWDLLDVLLPGLAAQGYDLAAGLAAFEGGRRG